MSLDVTLTDVNPWCVVYDASITHNLGTMADYAGVYFACWRPEEIGATKAKHLINILEEGIKRMKENPEYFKKFDSPNGWGMYDNFLPWLERYLQACIEHPDALICVSR